MNAAFEGGSMSLKLSISRPNSYSEDYVVKDDGIYFEQYEFNQFGDPLKMSSFKVMSREAFVEAFEEYIVASGLL